MNNHPGTDYGSGKTNIDLENDIRFGVIPNSRIDADAFEEFSPHYRDDCEAECPQCVNMFPVEAKPGDSVRCPECDTECEAELRYGAEPDGYVYAKGKYAVSAGDEYSMVCASEFYTYAKFCSPCFPGAGNLSSPFSKKTPVSPHKFRASAERCGFKKVYCLGFEFFSEHYPPPYQFIYRVSDGKLQISPYATD